MNANMLPDIPRLYTAIAEWSACMIYILRLKKRCSGIRFVMEAVLGLVLLCTIQIVAGYLPLALWIPSMIIAVCGMVGFILISIDMAPKEAGHCCARAFILAEFVASLNWQLYYFFFAVDSSDITVNGIIFTLLIYAVAFTFMYIFECRHLEKEIRVNISFKELWSAVGIALIVFLVSNISFVTGNTPFSSRLVPELFYIRTLAGFCGLVILYANQEQQRENQLKYELKAMRDVLNRQFEQYQMTKESMEQIECKYHDLKHHIAQVRAENNLEKRIAYLDEMENELKIHETQNKTGNQVLDTVLTTKSTYCKENGITLTCVANGGLLEFMETMDICSIFGNALENAIESVMKIEDSEKRLVHIALYAQNNFIIIRFENYFESKINMVDDLPATTKGDKSYHGYGLKSIRYTVEKYGGSMTVHTECNWFYLRILLTNPCV